MNKETYIYSFADECYVFYGDYKKDIEVRDKEIDRLNNIINELENYLNSKIIIISDNKIINNERVDLLYEVLDKLKELKENK